MDKRTDVINIAKILKDKKVGTKLYSPIFDECFLRKVDFKVRYPIAIISKNLEDYFLQDGRYYDVPSSECLIFPSKLMKDWARAINNGKDVDVESGTTICEYIFPELKDSEDDKIRKEIISILRNTYWTSNRNRFNELVAWLEKQGDRDKLIQELGKYKIKYTQ